MKKSALSAALAFAIVLPTQAAFAADEEVSEPTPIVEPTPEPTPDPVVTDPLPEPITDPNPEHCHAFGAGVRQPDWHDNLTNGECHFHIEDYDIYVPKPYTPPKEPEYVYISEAFPYYEPPNYQTWINIPTGPNITNINNNNINNVGSGGQMSLNEMASQYDQLLMRMLIEFLMERFNMDEQQAALLLSNRSLAVEGPSMYNTPEIKTKEKKKKKKKKKRKNR